MTTLTKIDKSDLSDSGLPIFETTELLALHRWCLKYRDLVRSEGNPTKEQDERFLRFQAICYTEGVACG